MNSSLARTGNGASANYGALDHYRMGEEQLSLRAQDPEFFENLALETGFYIDDAELSFLRTSRQNADALDQYARTILREAEEDTLGHFAKVAQNGNETIDFLQGHQLTTDDQEAIIAEGRKPYEFNEFKTIVNAVLGEAVAQRADWRAVPVNQRSAARTEIANKALLWVAQSNKIDNIKADWLRDGLLYGFGVAGVRQDPLDPEGRIQIMRCRPQEFMWDLNSAEDGMLTNVKWMWRMTWVDRMQLAAEFPEWRQEILSASGDFIATRGYEAQYTMVRPKVKVPVGSRDATTGQYNPHMRQMFGRLLCKREFYLRRSVRRWVISDPFEGKTYNCTSPDHAARQQDALEKFYMTTPVWSALGRLRETIFTARRANVEVIDQFIFIGDKLVRVNSDMDSGLPYVLYAPTYYNGDMTPEFDHLKGPQRWINRLMSFVDQLQAGGKGGMIIDGQWKPAEMTDEAFRNMFNTPNWKLVVNAANDPDFDARKIATYVQEQSNGQVVAALLPYLEGMMQKMGGGSNRMGLAAFAGQSGKSAESLRAAGSVLTMGAFDKFRRADAQLGQRVLYTLQYLHPAAQMRVYDEDMQPEFFSFLNAGVESLADLQYDIAVKEVMASPSERQARIDRLIDLMGYVPGIATHVVPTILKNADIDYSERKDIEAGMADDQKRAQHASEQQFLLEQEEMRRELTVKETNVYLKGRAQAFIELNVPKINLAGKLPTDPLTKATLMNWAGVNAGLNADPSMLMAGESADALLKQSILTMQQVEEDAHTPVWKRRAIENKIAVKSQTPSAKDQANRATREMRNTRAT